MERKPHPVHQNLIVQPDGRIFNKGGIERKYYQTEGQAYLVFKPKIGKQTYYAAARFVYEACNTIILEKEIMIYFINGDFNDRALTNLVAMTSDARKDEIAERLKVEKGGRRHPTLTDYVGFRDGKVYSLAKERYLQGQKRNTGYIRFGKLEGHKLVYECFNGLVDGKTHHVDHINNVHDDNKLENLQKLTRQENLLKAMTIDNPTSQKKGGTTLSKPLVRIKKDKDGTVVEQLLFENVQTAVTKTMEEFPNIKEMTANGLSSRTNRNETYKGFFWEFQETFDLLGEIWKDIPMQGVKLRVSNKGRVEFRNKRRTYGNVEGKSGYMVIEHKNKMYKVHFLVCAAFHPHPTNFFDKSITPDHKNHKVGDNRPENLSWATKRAQVLSRKCMKQVIAIDSTTNADLKVFDTIDDAREAYKIGRNTVIRSLDGTTKYSRALPNVRFEWREKVIVQTENDHSAEAVSTGLAANPQ